MSQKMIIVSGVIALLVAAIAIQYIYNPHPELNFGRSILLPGKLPPLGWTGLMISTFGLLNAHEPDVKNKGRVPSLSSFWP
jgi:hypothetical protein